MCIVLSQTYCQSYYWYLYWIAVGASSVRQIWWLPKGNINITWKVHWSRSQLPRLRTYLAIVILLSILSSYPGLPMFFNIWKKWEGPSPEEGYESCQVYALHQLVAMYIWSLYMCTSDRAKVVCSSGYIGGRKQGTHGECRSPKLDYPTQPHFMPMWSLLYWSCQFRGSLHASPISHLLLYPSLWLLVPGSSSQFLPLFPLQSAFEISTGQYYLGKMATRFCKLREPLPMPWLSQYIYYGLKPHRIMVGRCYFMRWQVEC